MLWRNGLFVIEMVGVEGGRSGHPAFGVGGYYGFRESGPICLGERFMKWISALSLVVMLAVGCGSSASTPVPVSTVDVGATVDAAVSATRAVERSVDATVEAGVEELEVAAPTVTPEVVAPTVTVEVTVPYPTIMTFGREVINGASLIDEESVRRGVRELYRCARDDEVFRGLWVLEIAAGGEDPDWTAEFVDAMLENEEVFVLMMLGDLMEDPAAAEFYSLVGEGKENFCGDVGLGSTGDGSYGVEFSCDDIMRRELILQPNANNADRMNQLVSVIQAREEHCVESVWKPVVVNGIQPSTGTAWAVRDPRSSCFAEAPGAHKFTVDGIWVPELLVSVESHGAGGEVVVPSMESVRDLADNILVYFGEEGLRADLSRCWLYLAGDRLWLASGQR